MNSSVANIIFNIYKGSDGLEHGLIVALNETTSKAWQSSNVLANANRSWDGAYNTNLITFSPAVTYVSGLGAGWYLPSIDELNILFNNRFYVNKALFDNSNTLLANTYWSSTETSLTSAYTFNFNLGNINSDGKINTYNVRAIRSF